MIKRNDNNTHFDGKMPAFAFQKMALGVPLFVGLVCLPNTKSAANPQGGQIQAGSGTIEETGSSVDVHQTSDKLIIDWDSFSIAPGEKTQFYQPHAGAIVLNRVVGGDLSQIYGRLEGNGTVMLVNPNGVIFGAGSEVNVGNLMATTHDILNQDFMAGKFEFSQNEAFPPGMIVNEGTITVRQGGYAALVAPVVRNEGVITARLGRVALGSAQAFTLDLYGDNLLTLRLPTEALPAGVEASDLKALVSHSGRIHADGGTVSLAAKAIPGLLENVVNMDGYVKANSVSKRGGTVILGGTGGAVKVSGGIDALGEDPDSQGGHIKISGDRVLVTETAALRASGQEAGGDITLSSVQKTTVQAGAVLEAKGLAQGSFGGRVVTASQGKLDFRGRVDTSALEGQGGVWRLEAADIALIKTASSSQESFSQIVAHRVEEALNRDMSVEIVAVGGESVATEDTGGDSSQGSRGDIILSGNLEKTEGHGEVLLTLKAAGDIRQEKGQKSGATSGTLDLHLEAGRDMSLEGRLETPQGQITAQANRHIVLQEANIAAKEMSFAANYDAVADQIGDKTSAGDLVITNSHLTAQGENGKGGDITLTGERVGLFEKTVVDVSGPHGGGVLKIGGDYQGQGEVRRSSVTQIGKDVILRADAHDQGDGGRVILWSDGSTVFHGQLSATGGAFGGDGGFAEISGKDHLTFKGLTDLGAAQGRIGHLLLDPTTINICTACATDIEGPIAGVFQETTPTAVSNLDVADLLAALSTGDVTLLTASGAGGAGNININTDIIYTGLNDRTLTLTANGAMTLAANVQIASTNNRLHLDMTSNNLLTLQNNSNINTRGGNVSLNGRHISLAGTTIDTGTGNLNINSIANTVSAGGNTITTNGGSVSFTAGGSGAGSSISLSGGDSITAAAGGSMSFAAIHVTLDGTLTSGTGGFSARANNNLSVQGNISSHGATTLIADADGGHNGGALTIPGTVNANGNDVLLQSNAGFSITGSVTGERISVLPSATTYRLEVGANSGAADVAIDATSLASMTASSVILGDSSMTNDMILSSPVFTNATRLRTGGDIIMNGSINTIGAQNIVVGGASPGVFQVNNGDINTNGGNLILSRETVLTGTHSFNTNGGAIKALTLDGGTSLTLNAQSGAINFTGLTTPTATLIGAVTGTGMNVNSLTVGGPSANLFGIVNGVAGDLTIRDANVAIPSSKNHFINNCSLISCWLLEDALSPDPVFEGEIPDVPRATLMPGWVLPLAPPPIGGGSVASGASPSGLVDVSDFPELLENDSEELSDFLEASNEDMLSEAILGELIGELGPEQAQEALEILGNLDSFDALMSGSVPEDAFGGQPATLIPGLLSYRPTDPNAEDSQRDPIKNYQLPSFALYQF